MPVWLAWYRKSLRCELRGYQRNVTALAIFESKLTPQAFTMCNGTTINPAFSVDATTKALPGSLVNA
ncbi:hypothetical protein PF002_g8987 [Phytophthora fragariae]|uniref:Uncharacterized protein n=1 Tax=Phytophthora fragariae TaxID=53985 RepID=A0A6A3FAN0_9STRA|nr:hypothetical protein PF009_g8750 [Phytophthora fragariae]KAE9148475.1 hypothetical protein PF006_g6937 [Phytophthora fragariae]KAE9241972.1 hypothetical protein PF002_g8987 [Phytophthora fragariae]